MKIYAFDFDGTLTTRDTLIELIRFVRGDRSLYWGMLLFLPVLVLMRLRLFSNGRAKQMVFTYFFGGMPIQEFTGYCQEFAAARRDLLRPKGLEMIAKAWQEGAVVMVVSASIDLWVTPFLGDVIVVGTRVEVADGRLTGRFSTANCYGQEKVSRILALYPDRQSYTLVAFGDSRGDREMLAFADESYYKPFRE